MKIIHPSQLSTLQIDIRGLQVFPENWTVGNGYSRYRSTPRPNSGLFIICTDVQVKYFQQEQEPVIAGKGDVIYIPRGVCYHAEVYGGVNNQIDTYTVNFHLLDRDGQELLLADRICILTSRRDDLFTIRAAALSCALHRAETPSQLKIKAALYHLLDTLASSTQEHSQVYYPIRAGVQALQAQWNQNRRIEEYAEMCGMGTAYFYRCFHVWSGKTPVEYRNEIRMSNAETLLCHTDQPINQIAQTVGFSDPLYFSRIFTKFFGLSPRKYRAAYQSRQSEN